MNNVLHAAAYRFVPLPDAAGLRPRLEDQARGHGLRGTILLAEEGINLFVAGTAESVRGFLADLQRDDRFADLDIKESWCDEPPYARLRVRLRPEIIRMNRPAVRPVTGRAPALDADTLLQWLRDGHDDTGRELVLLDTRNAFEVDQGAFDGAADWRLAKFSDFPDALEAHRDELEGKTVVTYCTGGIRCEKAALLMRDAGFEHVWQLDGGILRWFDRTQGAFFRGACFVFDDRSALDADLRPYIGASPGP